jgi:Fur family transcriptional regulator, ferric uptake regulator
MKRTHQKDLILDVFIANEGHLSVEDVYALVKKKDKKVGIVTVFRTLKSLKDCGIAKEIALGDGLTRFEHSYQHPLHHHIVCTSCQKVIEFLSPELERIHQSIVSRYEFQSSRQRIQIEGVCRECRNQVPRRSLPRLDSDKVFQRDAFRLAVAAKTRVLEFYRSAALHNQDPEGRAALQKREKGTQDRLERLSENLGLLYQQEKGLEHAPDMLHYDPRDIERLIPVLPVDIQGGTSALDARRVCEIALELEKRLAAFFNDYAEQFADCDGKRILQDQAGQPVCAGAAQAPNATPTGT